MVARWQWSTHGGGHTGHALRRYGCCQLYASTVERRRSDSRDQDVGPGHREYHFVCGDVPWTGVSSICRGSAISV